MKKPRKIKGPSVKAVKLSKEGAKRLAKLESWTTKDEGEKMKFSQETQNVYDLLIQGLKGREIAERLFISEKGVKYHKTKIYKQLGVKGRLELLKAKIEQNDGLLPSGNK